MVRGNGLLITGLVLVVLGIGGLALLRAGTLAGSPFGGSATERGEWIFRTGTAPDGRPLPYSGGMMMRMSCAGCHGVDGRGVRTPMFVSPNITYRNLIDPAGMLEPDGNRGATYNDELIKRAIAQGIDAEGNPLDWPMPRWHLADQDAADLLAYLKTL